MTFWLKEMHFLKMSKFNQKRFKKDYSNAKDELLVVLKTEHILRKQLTKEQ